MDIDFDKQPSDLAASSTMAGAKVRPRLRKHVSVSTSPTLSHDAKEKLSTQPASENCSNSSLSEIRVPDNDMINQSIRGTLSEDVKHYRCPSIVNERKLLIRALTQIFKKKTFPKLRSSRHDHTHYKNVIKKFQQEAAARKAAEEEEEDEAETAGEGATEAENAKCEELETASDAQVEAENGLRSEGGDDDELVPFGGRGAPWSSLGLRTPMGSRWWLLSAQPSEWFLRLRRKSMGVWWVSLLVRVVNRRSFGILDGGSWTPVSERWFEPPAFEIARFCFHRTGSEGFLARRLRSSSDLEEMC
ncbi:hypothetical protein ISN45_Aa04g000720 [Arabidopsis thaliana x Arabidopsis arenosa]|uniref:Uncharacterized protein n=1 Tax=Arabidopsis thaliana x Arabidopsis arenosa TaxID=1240361 RepID=A0A8T2A2T3_9BRAS|nr:hypothetical protein ISN45_Aa04g000720 [Arabidopsis thaliana x Arabidopsis arenosa]